MKKIILLITLTISLPTFGQSNVYKPFSEIYGAWWIRTDRYFGIGTGNVQTSITDELYFTSGDTIVNALKYKKVNYQNKGNAFGPVPPLNYIFNGGAYSFSYRNDSLNKKVYILLADSLQETLWYDFNLHLGDTLKNTYSVSNFGAASPPNKLLSVTLIDSVLICNNYYKSYGITSSQQNVGTYNCFYLIESVGFTTNFINALFGNNCFFEPTVVPNTYSWSLDACPNDLAVKTNMANTVSVKLYPNPVNSTLNINTSIINEKTQIIIADILGREIVNQAEENTSGFVLNTSNLPNGIYFISIKSKSINCTRKILVQH